MTGNGSDPSLRTLTATLRSRALDQADRPAFIFLLDGESSEARLTYGELDRQARAIAATLQQFGAAGKRALILCSPGLDFIASFFGCLYAGAIAVPAFPPRPNRSTPGLQAIAADAEPDFALTTQALLDDIERWSRGAGRLGSLRAVAVDRLDPGLAETWTPIEPAPDALAYLQYTSGSTSAPRGVMVTHDNLIATAQMINDAFRHPEHDVVVGWLPPYHDMGLIGTVAQPLHIGAPSVLMPPLLFLQRPLRWLKAISTYRADTSGGPNFAYDLCVRRIKPEQRETLDLSCWTLAFNGSEPVRAETLEAFATAFAPCGFRREAFYPCYGLAEATLFVSGGLRAAAPVVRGLDDAALQRHRVRDAAAGGDEVRRLVGCGSTRGGLEMRIVDPETRRSCPADTVGEIWLRGRSVARGYWNRADATRQAFHAYLADDGEGPFLRTGDLGFIKDGELFVTGRLKDLIIVDGRNHYPQDIEETVERSHALLRPGGCAAFSVEIDGRERLVVVAETDYRPDRRAGRPDAVPRHEIDAAVRAVRRVIAERHDLRADMVVPVKPGSVPRTSSGKVRRQACRSLFLSGALEASAVRAAAPQGAPPTAPPALADAAPD